MLTLALTAAAWKPMASVGAGVIETRVHTRAQHRGCRAAARLHSERVIPEHRHQALCRVDSTYRGLSDAVQEEVEPRLPVAIVPPTMRTFPSRKG